MASNPSPVKIGPFNLGMNSRLPDTELKVPRVGTFLRSAVNVDITGPGTVRRRAGAVRQLEGADCHSLWFDEIGQVGYMADGTEFFVLTGPATGLVKTLVRGGLTPGVRLSYTQSPLGAVCTDGTRLDRLVAGAYIPLSLPLLEQTPVVAAGSGFLLAGTYTFAFTYFDADMRQSGSTVPQQVTLAAAGGFDVTGLPAAFPDGVAGVIVYMSEPDGDELFQAEVIDTPATTLAISFPRTLVGRCPTLLKQPLPGGSIVRHSNGRFVVARDNVLYFSDAYSTLYDPADGFIPFPSDVLMVEPVDTGLWVATRTDTYFLAGDITKTTLHSVLPYGAIAGTSGTYPDKERCYWMSPRGLVQADNQGSATNVQEKAVTVGKAITGAAMYREQDGTKQVVTSLFGSETSGAAAYSYMDAEIIRKATTL